MCRSHFNTDMAYSNLRVTASGSIVRAFIKKVEMIYVILFVSYLKLSHI